MKQSMKKMVVVLIAVLLVYSNVMPTAITGALKAYAATYQVADENFMTLGTSPTATLPTNWKVSKETNVRSVGSYETALTATERLGGSGLTSTSSNGIYNFGVNADYTHRAVGFLSSSNATKSGNLYYKWTNHTESNISSFTISYDVEKFRNGSNPAGFTIGLYYSLNGVDWTKAGSQFDSSFGADANSEGAAVVPLTVQKIDHQALSLSLPNGGPVYFAWNYSVTNGGTTSNAQGLGITNVQITAESGGGPAAVSQVVAAPNSGDVPDGTPITLATSTTGAAVYYSVYSPYPNQTDSGVYTAPIVLNFNGADTITVQTYASANGMTDSNISTFQYTQAKLGQVTATPGSSEVTPGTKVALSAAADATIYYTTNGATPNTGSAEYTGSLTIPALPYTVKAIAVKNGYLQSEVAAFTYTLASEHNYNLDGENGTAAEWAFTSASNFTQPVPATGGEWKNGAGMTLWFGATERSINFGSNGANATGWDNGSGTKYWMVQTSTKGMAELSLSWRMRSSGSGPRDFKVQYSTDSATWTDIPNAAITVPNAGSLLDAANLFKVALPEAASHCDRLSLRWVMTSNTSTSGGTVGSGGTHQINNIALSGGYVIGDNQVYAVTSDQAAKVPLHSVATFATRTTGAEIRYSTDGGATYTAAVNGQVALDTLPVTLQVKAVSGGMDDSRVKNFHYEQAKVAAVSPSPGAGAIPSNAAITLTAVPADADIYYTLTTKAGTDEEAIQPEAAYSAPIALAEGMFPLRITVRATKANYLDSDSISYTYTAKKPTGGEKNYYGQLHSHTINSDGAGTVEEAFAWARDYAKLDFFALTDHSNSIDTAPAGDKAGTYNLGDYNKNNVKWQHGKQAAIAAAVPGKFVGFYGYEMTWSGGPGHINTFGTEGFVSRNNTELNNKTNDAGLRAYYELLKLHPEAVAQFNHPGTTFGNFNGYAYYDPIIDERISLIEVGNGEGAVDSGGYFTSYEQYDMALDKGWHLAPTNNQDNHKGMWGNSNTARTVVYTNDFTMEGILQGMKAMRVYATEDANLDIVYTLNGEQLGTILNTVPTEAAFKVKVRNTAGSNKVKSIAIITNGGVEAYKQTFGTADAVMDYVMPSPKAGHYYIKVVQEDGRIAVTAPVWLGKAENVGISDLTSSTSTPVTTEALTLTTEVFNNEVGDAILNSVKYQIKDGAVIADLNLDTPIAASSSVKHTQSFTPTEARKITLLVTVSVKVKGVDKFYTKEIELNVKDISKLNYIGIDASHLNEYVAGNYKDSMKNLNTLAMQYGLRTVPLKTNEEFLAATANPRYKMMIITAPTRRLDPASGSVHQYYSPEEIAAVAGFAKKGNPVIITGWGDFYESYAYVTPGLENHMAGQQNKLLAAIGSTLRLADDEAKDDVTNGGQPQRLYLEDHHGLASPLLAGMLEGQRFSQYGGSTVYAVHPDGTPALSLPDSVTPIVSGFATTYSSDDDKDGYGFEDKEVRVPRYGDSPDAGKGAGKVLVAASEEVQHGEGKPSQVIVAGGAFISDFEIKNAALDNLADAYSNEVIVRNLLASIENIVIHPISDIKTAAAGTELTIEGIATVSVYDGNSENNTGFFDSIYVQDASGGINLFPVANGVQAGQKIRVTGVVSSYQGERQLAVSGIQILDVTIRPEAPVVVSTKDAMTAVHTGKLIKTSGEVKRVVAEPNGTVNEITIDDGSGEAIVYINAYITPAKSLSFVKKGAVISVTGLGSIGENFTSTTDFLPRIRVRDRGEIELVRAHSYTVKFDSDGGTAVNEVTGIEPGKTIALPSAPTKSGYTFVGWFTGKNGTGTAFTAATVINSSMTLYANWVTDGGEGPGTSPTPIPTPTPTTTATPTPTPTATPEPSATDGKTVVVTATVNAATGEAKAVLTDHAALALAEAVKKAEAARQKAVVHIKVEAAANAKSLAVEMPRDAFDKWAAYPQVELILHTEFGEVTLGGKALQVISKAADSGAITISIAKVDPSALTTQALSRVGDRPVFDYKVKAGNSEISSFGGAKVTIGIPYTLKNGEQKNAVVANDLDNSNKMQPVRGMYKPAQKAVIFTVSHFSRYAVAYNEVRFTDVAANAWYNEAVGFVAARGITTGTGNELYSPGAKLTRGQFMVMVMKAYGLEPSNAGAPNFSDAGDTYYTPYLAAAKNAGITSGVGNNRFAPSNEISRQEMVTLLYQVLNYIGELPDKRADKPLSAFNDANQVSSWAKDAMALFVEAGLLSGYEGKLAPRNITTRADMAQMIYNLLSP